MISRYANQKIQNTTNQILNIFYTVYFVQFIRTSLFFMNLYGENENVKNNDILTRILLTIEVLRFMYLFVLEIFSLTKHNIPKKINAELPSRDK